MIGTIVMTGATGGIGRVAAGLIARDHPAAHLVVLARGDGGRAVVDSLGGVGAAASALETDLLSLGRVRAAADVLASRLRSGELPPLRAIVANAGLQVTNALTLSPEGFEATFAVNVLANHVLIRRLQEHLTPPARIVITVSDTHFGDLRHNLGMVPAPRWRDPELLARPGAFPRPETARAGRTAYSTSKLVAIHLVHEYARRLPAGIEVVGYNPGFVPATGLAREAGPLTRLALRWVMPLLTVTPLASSPDEAGRHLAALVGGQLRAPTGAYVDRGKVARSSGASYDPAREHALWETVERLTARFLA